MITVVVGGILLYEVIQSQSNSDYCQEWFENFPSPIFDGCSQCLQHCYFKALGLPIQHINVVKDERFKNTLQAENDKCGCP